MFPASAALRQPCKQGLSAGADGMSDCICLYPFDVCNAYYGSSVLCCADACEARQETLSPGIHRIIPRMPGSVGATDDH